MNNPRADNGGNSSSYGTGVPAPESVLSVVELIRVMDIAADLMLANASMSLSGDLLAEHDPAAISRDLREDDLSSLRDQSQQLVDRWARLVENTTFMQNIALRLNDAQFDYALRLANLHDSAHAIRLREAAQAEGGIAEWMRPRIDGLQEEFAARLRAAEEIRGLLTGQSSGMVTTFASVLGCALGVVEVGVGGYLVYQAVAITVATKGAAAPGTTIIGAEGAALTSAGLITVSMQCF
jgi:hypothetical protein